jgi:hypothetical protein
MGNYEFIKKSCINHSREVVEERISKLQPLNYNQFRWWRTHTDNVTPLGKRAPLKDRITNGEFEPSAYLWMAQYALYVAKDKVNLKTDCHQKQLENLAVDLARYKRLMEDYEKEESQRMEALYDAFTSAFRLTREELTEKFLVWSGDIASFYDYANEFFYTTPAENRKRGRGRPPGSKNKSK